MYLSVRSYWSKHGEGPLYELITYAQDGMHASMDPMRVVTWHASAMPFPLLPISWWNLSLHHPLGNGREKLKTKKERVWVYLTLLGLWFFTCFLLLRIINARCFYWPSIAICMNVFITFFILDSTDFHVLEVGEWWIGGSLPWKFVKDIILLMLEGNDNDDTTLK